MLFKDLGLRKELLQAIEGKGYTEATPVQMQAIPIILKGGDLLVGAQTGTGKTAGFTLPLLQKLMANYRGNTNNRKPRGLILAPTRELAAQIADSVAMYGKHLPLKAQAVFGGVNIFGQLKRLKQGADILIATPGRLLDLISQRAVDLSSIEIFILDEADRMMDMGFIHDIKKIMALVPNSRQSLLFSATFSREIKNLAQTLLKSPQTIEVAPHNTPAELITQVVYPVDSRRKRELLSFLISSQKWKQVLVFTRTKHSANRLSQQLIDDGIAADAIHGNKSQAARMKALRDFKVGSVSVLVATDIVARGLDIDNLPHVVNFELPTVPEDYIHRIGRTGRAGNEGRACSLVCIDERRLLADIERLLKQRIPTEIISGYEPDPSIPAEPIRRGGNRPSNQNFKANKNGNRPQKQHVAQGDKHKSNKQFYGKKRKFFCKTNPVKKS